MMNLTARDLIECAKAMTEEEKAELAAILGMIRMSANLAFDNLARESSGLRAHQAAMFQMTPEQREDLRRSCLL
jgi:hypothetical protein